MSKYSIEKITCPVCKKQHDFTIWDNINSEENPEAKRKLLDGALFTLKCRKCKNETPVSYPCVYYAPSQNTMIYLVNENNIQEAINIINATNEKINVALFQDTSFQISSLNGKKRIVTTHNALREKAIILEQGLDDRVIEIMKLIYIMDISENHHLNISEAYFFVEDGKQKIQFISNKVFQVNVQENMYEDIIKQYGEKLKKENKDYIIDSLWAYKFIS